MHLIDQEFPGTSKFIEGLASAARQEVLSQACCFAAARLTGQHPEIDSIASDIKHGRKFAPGRLEEIRKQSEAEDANYFKLQEAGKPQADWLPCFSKARWLLAVAAGFQDDSVQSVLTGLYECSKSMDLDENSSREFGELLAGAHSC